MREATSTGETLYYFVADHLGSTSVTLDASGNKIGEMKYYPFGETRPGYPTGSVPTDRRFTGQREETGLGSLYDYNARFYSPVLGRFISADTIVPDGKNPQQFNRYAYGLNNPVKYIDPSGHMATDDNRGGCGAKCKQPPPLQSRKPMPNPFLPQAPAMPPADTGVLLMVYDPGYIHRRQETTFTHIDGELVPIIEGDARYRFVQIFELLGGQALRQYYEASVSGGIAGKIPYVAKVGVGVEWTSSGQGFSPYVQAALGDSASVTLQPGQLMLGGDLPIEGGAGIAGGVEWNLSNTRYFLTHQSYLDMVGGTQEFIALHVGHPDAALIDSLTYPGFNSPQMCFSGYYALKGYLDRLQFAQRVAPYEEVP